MQDSSLLTTSQVSANIVFNEPVRFKFLKKKGNTLRNKAVTLFELAKGAVAVDTAQGAGNFW